MLLDAEMPHLNLPDAVRTLRAEAPSCALVVLTLHTAAVTQAIGVGVTAVVGKHEGTSALVAAIRSGTAYVNVHSTLYPGGEIRAQIERGHEGHHHH